MKHEKIACFAHSPVNLIVFDAKNQCDDGKYVEESITNNGKWGNLWHNFEIVVCCKTASARDDNQVEDSWADDGPRADVIVGDKDADDGGEQFRGRCPERT